MICYHVLIDLTIAFRLVEWPLISIFINIPRRLAPTVLWPSSRCTLEVGSGDQLADIGHSPAAEESSPLQRKLI